MAIPGPNIINTSYVRACHRSLLVRLSAPQIFGAQDWRQALYEYARDGIPLPRTIEARPVPVDHIALTTFIFLVQYLAQGISSQTQVTNMASLSRGSLSDNKQNDSKCYIYSIRTWDPSACRKHSCLSIRSLYPCSRHPCHALSRPSESSSENSVLRLAIPEVRYSLSKYIYRTS